MRGWREFVCPYNPRKSSSDTVTRNRASTVGVVNIETRFPGTAGDIKSRRKAKPFYFIVTGEKDQITVRAFERMGLTGR